MIFLLNMVPMRMSIEKIAFMACSMRSDNFKKAIKVEQAAITITKCGDGRKIMSVFYPLLGGTFSATIEWLFRAGLSNFVYIEQRIQNDKACPGCFKNRNMLSLHCRFLTCCRKDFEKIAPVVVIPQPDMNRCFVSEGLQQRLQLTIVCL